MNRIETYDIEFVTNHPELGEIWEVNCPRCHCNLRLCELMSSEDICECNIKWSIDQKAIGESVDE